MTVSGNGVVCAGKDESDQCLEITSFSLLEALLCKISPTETDTAYLSSVIPLPDSFHVSVLDRKVLYYTDNGVIRFEDTDTEVPPDAMTYVTPEELGDVEPPLIAPFWAKDIYGTVSHQIYNNSDDLFERELLMRVGSNVRDWDDTNFASSIAFIPTWAMVISWENVKHLNYPSLTNTLECILASDGSHTFSVFNYQSVYWPVAEDLQLGIDTGSTVTQINVESFSETITTRDGIDVYQLHEGIGNSGLPGRWLFRLDSYDSSNSDAKEMCENYLSENQNNPLELMYVKKCPEQLSSILSLQFYPCSFESLEDQDLINFGNPSNNCLTQKILSSYPETSPGSYCAYDQDGFLKPFISRENVWDSSVVQKFPPVGRTFNEDQQVAWLNQDIDFRHQCCVLSGSDDHCDLYQALRPSPSEGTGNVRYAAAGE
ncbi:putative mucin-4-like [Apostichopus japonicus]|uniref:Putative mucin-4-like n=1 Tax=Stichopus japonicus TaxID=307972 RepID=A0A2G8KFI3_STIJA|nr:putative mucin-4-like [Apostichopus japonicus]